MLYNFVMSRTKYETGQKFGMLTLIKEHRKNKHGSIIWEALCDCGKSTHVYPNNAKNGTHKSCGCYSKSIRKSNGEKSRKHDPIISSAKIVWRSYKNQFVDFESFYKISQKNCHYCGRPPHRTFNQSDYPRKTGGQASDYQRQNGNFTYNGLDRVDSSKAHTMDNVVPCCWICNRMKNDLSVEDFISHIKLIINYYA